MILPLQAIVLADELEMWENTLSGEKTITIRAGHRDYKEGRVILCNPDNGICVEADIAFVKHTTLEKLPTEDLLDDGFADLDECLEGMSRFYPDLTRDSPVTVVRWANVRGKAVEMFREP